MFSEMAHIFSCSGNKDNEVDPSYYNNRVINPYGSMELDACGRSDAASGTEGHFDLVDTSDNNKVIRSFYWDCPWGSKTNQWVISQANSKWDVYSKGANLDSGALGTITVDVINKSAL